MSKKLQLNLRMDKEPELLEEMKRVAAENEMSLNEFAIASFRAMVELRTPIKLSRMVEKINSLVETVAEVKAECEDLNSRLTKLEKLKQ